jgi:anaerobic selenocysteine-containing dehydrogenase
MQAAARSPGLRAQVMADFAPDKVEARTGIPASKIEETCPRNGLAPPSVVVVDEGMSDHATMAAAIVVNALLG